MGEYADKMSFLIAREESAQWMEYHGALHPMQRKLVSEFALVRIGDDSEGFRGVYGLDGRPVRERQDRLQRLFLDSPQAAVDQARQIADESARYNMGQIRRNFNTPTIPYSARAHLQGTLAGAAVPGLQRLAGRPGDGGVHERAAELWQDYIGDVARLEQAVDRIMGKKAPSETLLTSTN